MRLFPVLSLLLLVPARAQEHPHPMTPAPSVTVAGTGTVAAAPDRAQLTFGVETVARDANEAMRANERESQAVLTAVRQFGIADRQIQLLGLHLQPDYGPEGDTGRLRASRRVLVTLDSIRLVPDLVAAVTAAGANRFEQLQYQLRDAKPVEDRALREAVERARARATVAAAAAGRTLGPVLTVVEQGAFVRPPQPFESRGYADAQALKVEGTPGAFSAGEIEVEARVAVTFSLQ